MSAFPNAQALYGTGIAFGGLPFNTLTSSTSLAGNLRASYMGLPLSLVGPSGIAAIPGAEASEITVSSTLAGLVIQNYGPLLNSVDVVPGVSGLVTDNYGPITTSISFNATLAGTHIPPLVYGTFAHNVSVSAEFVAFTPLPPVEALLNAAVMVTGNLEAIFDEPGPFAIGAVIDCRAGGGDLVVLGKAIVLPVSDNDSGHFPLDGGVRFNPTTNLPQVYRDETWHDFGDGVGASLTYPSILQTQLLGRTQTGTGDPNGIEVGTNLVLANTLLWATLCGPFMISGNHVGTMSSSMIIPLGVVPFTFSADPTASYARSLTAPTADTVLTIKKKTGSAAATTVGTATFTAGETRAVVAITAPVLTTQDFVYVEGPVTADSTIADLSFMLRCSGALPTEQTPPPDVPVDAPTIAIMMQFGGYQTVATPVISYYEKAYFGAKTVTNSTSNPGADFESTTALHRADNIQYTAAKPGRALIGFESAQPGDVFPHPNMQGPFYLTTATHNLSYVEQSAGGFYPTTVFQYDNLVKGQEALFNDAPIWQPTGGAAIDGKFRIPAINVPIAPPLDGAPLISAKLAENAALGIVPTRKLQVDSKSISPGEIMDRYNITLNRSWYYSEVLDYHPSGFPKRIKSYSATLFGVESDAAESPTTKYRFHDGDVFEYQEIFHFDELTPVYSSTPLITTSWPWSSGTDRWFDLPVMAFSADGATTYLAGTVSNDVLTTDFSSENRAFIGAYDTVTGETIWTKTIDGSTTGSRVRAMQVSGGNLVVFSQFSNSTSDVRIGKFTLDTTTGATIGTPLFLTTNEIVGSSKVSGTSTFLTTDYRLYRLDSTAAPQWTRIVNTSGDVLIWKSVMSLANGNVVGLGTVYHPTLDNHGVAAYCFNSSGTQQWAKTWGDPVWGGTPHINRDAEAVDGRQLSDGNILVWERYKDEREAVAPYVDWRYVCRQTVTKINPSTGAIIWQRAISGEWYRDYNYTSCFTANDDFIVICVDRWVIVLNAIGDISHVYNVNLITDVDWDIKVRSVEILGDNMLINYFQQKSMIDSRRDATVVVAVPLNMVEDYLDYDTYTVSRVGHQLTSVDYTPSYGPMDPASAPISAVVNTDLTVITQATTTYTESAPVVTPNLRLAKADLPAKYSTAGNYWIFSMAHKDWATAGKQSGLFYMEHRHMCIDPDTKNIFVFGYFDTTVDRLMVYKISPTGNIIWNKHFHDNRIHCFGAYVDAGIVYCYVDDGQFFKFNADTGAIISSKKLFASFNTSTNTGSIAPFVQPGSTHMANIGNTVYLSTYGQASPFACKIQVYDPVTETIGIRMSYTQAGATRTQVKQMAAAGGYIYCEGLVLISGANRCFAMKIRADDLTMVWSKKYLSGDNTATLQTGGGYITVDSSGNQYRMVGFTVSGPAPNLTKHWVITKWDTDGNIVWSKVYRVIFPDEYKNVHCNIAYSGAVEGRRIIFKDGKLYLCFSTRFNDSETNSTKNTAPGIMVVNATTGEPEWTRAFIANDGNNMGTDGWVNIAMDDNDLVLTVTRLEGYVGGGCTMVMRLPVGTGKEIASQIDMDQHRFSMGVLVSIAPTATATDFTITQEAASLTVAPETPSLAVTTIPIVSVVDSPAGDWVPVRTDLR